MTYDAFLSAMASTTVNEVPKLVSGIVLLGLAWVVGLRLAAYWNVRQKRREYDILTARDFHDLYGEFFAIWKLWNYYRRDIGSAPFPQASRWALLERSCGAEGKMESTLVRITCEKALDEVDIATLGHFRQLYQRLRQSIRDDEALPWDSSDHPEYVEFKRLAPKIAALVVGADLVERGSSPDVLGRITSNEWERKISG